MNDVQVSVPSSSEIQQFGQWVSAAARRAQLLQGTVLAEANPSPTALNRTLEELQTSLEELQVAYEELQVQQDVLLEHHEQVVQERQRYQDLFQFGIEGALVTDSDGKINDANQMIGKLLNVPAHYLVGKPLATFVPLDRRAAFRQRLLDLQRPWASASWDTLLQYRDHPAIPVTLSAKRCPPPYDDELWWLVRDRRSEIAAEAAIQLANIQLEQKVQERTATLIEANQRLWAEVKAREQAEQALQFQTQQERLLQAVAHHIRSSLNLEEVLQTTVTEVRSLLQVDRVVILQFQPNGTKQVVTEARHDSYRALLGQVYHEPCLNGEVINHYCRGGIRAFADVQADEAGLHSCLVEALLQMQVRALLVVPILQNDRFWGLLIAHHCRAPRPWQDHEQTLLTRLTTQIGIAIQQSELHAKTHQLATVDSLTEIANRRWFDQYLDKMWKQHQRDQIPLALVLADIDHFKTYNDSYGHPAGDRCLRTVAALLDRYIQRPHDLVARYGGEEFAIVLPNTDGEGVRHIAETICQNVQRLNLPHREASLKILTMSFGVTSLVPAVDQSVEEFIQRADQALYRAKVEGRNRVVVW
jgi:diguanylate cyclase (GGDEF)-like protein